MLFRQDDNRDPQTDTSGTNIRAALEHFGRTNSRRRVVFLVSDFQDNEFEKTLRITRRKHDVIPVIVGDAREYSFPSVGLIRLKDPESGEIIDVDTSSKRNRNRIESIMQQQQESIDAMLRRMKLEPIRLLTGEDYVDTLAQYFQRRHARK